MTADRPVTVVKRRWESSAARPTRFAATVIDEDDRGLWLRSDPLTIHRDLDGAFVYIATHTWLSLVPRDEMWFAMFAGANLKVDVCLPPVIGVDTIEFCDLELDVVMTIHPEPRDLRIVDQDEFAALGLPADLAAACEGTAEQVRDLIAGRQPPFDEVLDERIEAVVGSDPLLHAGPLVRFGWIAPAFPSIHDQLGARFGWTDADLDRTVIAGARGDVHVLVVDGELAGTYADDDTPAGLDTLVKLTLEAARRVSNEPDLDLDALPSGV